MYVVTGRVRVVDAVEREVSVDTTSNESKVDGEMSPFLKLCLVETQTCVLERGDPYPVVLRDSSRVETR